MYVSSLSLSLCLPLTCSLVFFHVHIFSHFHKDLQTYKICLFVCFNVCRVVAFVLRGMDCRIFPVHTNSRNISSSKAILPHHFGASIFSLSLSLPTSLSPPLSLQSTRSGGTVVLVGMGAAEVKLPIINASVREVDIRGIFRYVNW